MKKLLKHQCIQFKSLDEYYKILEEYNVTPDPWDTDERIEMFLRDEGASVVGVEGVWIFEENSPMEFGGYTEITT